LVDDDETYRYVVCLSPEYYVTGGAGGPTYYLNASVCEIDALTSDSSDDEEPELPPTEPEEPTYTSLVDAETTSWGANGSNTSSQLSSDRNLTDNDESTKCGAGSGFKAVWIDLGAEKPIDKVTSIINDGTRNGDGLTWYVTKEDPINAIKAGTISTWKAVGTLTSTTTGKHEVSFLVDDDELYQYVVVLHPTNYTGATYQEWALSYVCEIDALTGPYVSLVDENTISYHSQGTGVTKHDKPILTDKDNTTIVDRGSGWNAGWIDLGAEKPIDKVTSVINTGSGGGAGLTWYLTNNNPIDAIKADDISSWKQVGSFEGGTQYKSYTVNFLVDGDEMYQYVVCLNPEYYINGGAGGPTYFMMGSVAEIDVFTEPTTNVALNRPGFASGYNVNAWPDLATDGRTATGFQCGGKTLWYYVDLGAAYTIDNIQLTMGTLEAHRKDYTVHLSNQRQDAVTTPTDKVLVYTADGSGKNGVGISVAGHATLTDEQKAAKYQYVYIEKNAAATDGITVHELEVHTKDEEIDEYLVEIGAHKPTFAAVMYNSSLAPRAANDRNPSSRYATKPIPASFGDDLSGNSITQVQRFVIDLEKAYPIRAIAYYAYHQDHSVGYTIYGTNNSNFYSDKTELCTASETKAVGYKIYPVTATDEFRYIVIESHGDINDLLVYTDNASAEPNYTSDKGSTTHLISLNAPIVSVRGGTSDSELGFGYINDGAIAAGTKHWNVAADFDTHFYMDLGSPQAIDYIAVNNLQGTTNFLFGMKLVATNDPTFTEETVIFDAGNNNMIGTASNTELPPKSFSLYEAPAAMEGEKYRYVGMRLKDMNGTPHNWSRAKLAEFSVYTKEENLTEVFNKISFSQSETNAGEYSVSTQKYLSVTGRPVTFIAAAYDEEDKLVEVKSSKLATQSGVQNALSGTISFAGSQNLSKIKTVKTMLWDDVSVLRPIVASESFDIPYVSLVDEETKSYYVHDDTFAAFNAAEYGTGSNQTPANILTDGNTNTRIGSGNGYNAVWIDLGSAKQIDKVTSVASLGTRGGKGMTWYLAKEDPTIAMKAGNLSSWKKLGSIESEATYSTTTLETLNFDVDDTELYRYVVCLDPDHYNKGLTGATSFKMRGSVAEINAFKSGLYVD